MTTALTRRIASAISDGRVDSAEVADLIQAASGTAPGKAALTSLLSAHADIFDADAKLALRASLSQPAAISLPAAARRQKINKPDASFEKLSAGVGRSVSEVTIGMLDLGFDLRVPSISDNLRWSPTEIVGDGIDNDRNGKPDDVVGWSFTKDSGDVSPGPVFGAFHGTATLSLATANTSRIKAVLAQAVGGAVPLTPAKLAEAFEYLASSGAKIVNVSAGWYAPDTVKAARETIARHPDVLFVVSAGNDFQELGTVGRENLSEDHCFAATQMPNLVVVAAAEGNALEIESNFSKRFVTIGAAINADSAELDGTFRRRVTTSFATPIVTNLLAKCAIIDPALTPIQLKTLLTATARKSPTWAALVQSGGLIDAEKALRVAALSARLRVRGATLDAAARELGIAGADKAAYAAIVAQLRP